MSDRILRVSSLNQAVIIHHQINSVRHYLAPQFATAVDNSSDFNDFVFTPNAVTSFAPDIRYTVARPPEDGSCAFYSAAQN